MNRRLLTTLSVLALGCASTPSAQPPSNASTQPRDIPRTPAYDLARRIAWTAGFDRAYQVKQLDFSFVVEREGKEVFVARHQWDLENNRDRVTWTDREGRKNDAILNVTSRTARGTVDGEKVVGDAERQLAEAAYARWVNDTYWFLLPVKLFDDGSKLEAVDPREYNGKEHPVLELSFDAGVGLTSGDKYWLYVDPDAFRIVRWEMKLEGQTDPPRGTSWESYRPVGPLLLAHEHKSDDGKSNVRFDDTAAHREVVESAFTLE